MIDEQRSDTEALQFKACLLSGHGREPLSRVCIDSACTQRNLICYVCEKNNHATHQTVSLFHFLKEMEKEGEELTTMNLSGCVGIQIDKFEEKLVEGVSETSTALQDHMSSLSRMIHEMFLKIKSAKMCELSCHTDSLRRELKYDHRLKTVELLNSFRQFLSILQSPKREIELQSSKQLSKLSAAASFIETGLIHLTKDLSELLERAGSMLEGCMPLKIPQVNQMRDSRMEEEQPLQIQHPPNRQIETPQPQPSSQNLSISKQTSNVSSAAEKIKPNSYGLKDEQKDDKPVPIPQAVEVRPRSTNENIKQIAQKNTSPNLTWNCKEKSYLIQLSKNDIVAKRFLNDPKCLAGVVACQSTKRWALRLHLEVGPIFVGICLKSKLAQKGYESGPQWEKLGHGNYIVGTDGLVFSHSQTRLNYHMSSFQIKQSALLHFTLNSSMNTLFIEDKKGGIRVQLLVEDSNQDYRPCVYLLNIQDQAELLDYETSK